MRNHMSGGRRFALAVLAAAVVVPLALAHGASGREAGINGVEHFGCYSADLQNFVSRSFVFKNQFGSGKGTLKAPQLLCAPARKNKEPVQNATSHLMCYAFSWGGNFKHPNVLVKNQFGQLRFKVLDATSFCMPAAKSTQALPAVAPKPPGHFTCYGLTPLPGTPGFTSKGMTLRDQFETVNGVAYKVASLCAPTRKNNEPVFDTKIHLLCYLFKSATKVHPFVFVRDQFEKMRGPIVTRRQVCVPSAKKVTD